MSVIISPNTSDLATQMARHQYDNEKRKLAMVILSQSVVQCYINKVGRIVGKTLSTMAKELGINRTSLYNIGRGNGRYVSSSIILLLVVNYNVPFNTDDYLHLIRGVGELPNCAKPILTNISKKVRKTKKVSK